MRYADLSVSGDGQEIWCVGSRTPRWQDQSRHRRDPCRRRRVLRTQLRVRVLVAGSRFLAYPTESPRRPPAGVASPGTTRTCRGTVPNCGLRTSTPTTCSATRGASPADRASRSSQPGWCADGASSSSPIAPVGGTSTSTTARVGCRCTCPLDAEFAGPQWVFGRRRTGCWTTAHRDARGRRRATTSGTSRRGRGADRVNPAYTSIGELARSTASGARARRFGHRASGAGAHCRSAGRRRSASARRRERRSTPDTCPRRRRSSSPPRTAAPRTACSTRRRTATSSAARRAAAAHGAEPRRPDGPHAAGVLDLERAVLDQPRLRRRRRRLRRQHRLRPRLPRSTARPLGHRRRRRLRQRAPGGSPTRVWSTGDRLAIRGGSAGGYTTLARAHVPRRLRRRRQLLRRRPTSRRSRATRTSSSRATSTGWSVRGRSGAPSTSSGRRSTTPTGSTAR